MDLYTTVQVNPFTSGGHNQKGSTLKTLFARVISFHKKSYQFGQRHSLHYGFAETEDGQTFYFKMRFCRRIDVGQHGRPVISQNPCSRWPNVGEHIVLVPSDRPSPEGRVPEAFLWGYREYWDKILNAPPEAVSDEKIIELVPREPEAGSSLEEDFRKRFELPSQVEKFNRRYGNHQRRAQG